MTKPIDRARLVSLLGRFAGQPTNKLVLIVDDDADVRRILRTTIEGAGMSAVEAANGREALERLAAGPRPALLLLDLMMPEVDGFGTLDAIRSDPGLADLPVVILTAKDLSGGRADLSPGARHARVQQGRAIGRQPGRGARRDHPERARRRRLIGRAAPA